jgi:hypothetical protein
MLSILLLAAATVTLSYGQSPASSTPRPDSSASASAVATPTKLPPPATYAEFLNRLTTPSHLVELVKAMDHAVDQAEEDGFGLGETSLGVQVELRQVHANEVIMYQAVVSRGGAELKYNDATKIMAFLCDRIGLTHPIDVREGEKPVFYGQWLIREKEWKALRKKMLEVRAANRAEPDLRKAFGLAIQREMAARQAAQSKRG